MLYATLREGLESDVVGDHLVCSEGNARERVVYTSRDNSLAITVHFAPGTRFILQFEGPYHRHWPGVKSGPARITVRIRVRVWISMARGTVVMVRNRVGVMFSSGLQLTGSVIWAGPGFSRNDTCSVVL